MEIHQIDYSVRFSRAEFAKRNRTSDQSCGEGQFVHSREVDIVLENQCRCREGYADLA